MTSPSPLRTLEFLPLHDEALLASRRLAYVAKAPLLPLHARHGSSVSSATQLEFGGHAF